MSVEQNRYPKPPPPNVIEWISIWTRALTRPTPAAYRELFADPTPNRVTALAWLVTGGVIAALISMLTYPAPPLITGLLIICAMPMFALVYTAITVITARSALWIAAQMDGGGTLDQLLTALAAVNAPMSILSALVYLLPNGYLIAYALGVYWIYLTILAVKVITRLSWGKAALASAVFIALSLLVVVLSVGVALLPAEV